MRRSALWIGVLLAVSAVACANGGEEDASDTSEPTETAKNEVVAEAKEEGCLVDGKRYRIDESFKRECNACVCTALGPSCTKRACSLP